jgi:hypothetical protein
MSPPEYSFGEIDGIYSEHDEVFAENDRRSSLPPIETFFCEMSLVASFSIVDVVNFLFIKEE